MSGSKHIRHTFSAHLTPPLNRFHFLRSIMLVPSSLIRTFYYHSLAIFPFPSFISRDTTHRGGSRVVGHRDGLTKVGILFSKSCGCPSYNWIKKFKRKKRPFCSFYFTNFTITLLELTTLAELVTLNIKNFFSLHVWAPKVWGPCLAEHVKHALIRLWLDRRRIQSFPSFPFPTPALPFHHLPFFPFHFSPRPSLPFFSLPLSLPLLCPFLSCPYPTIFCLSDSLHFPQNRGPGYYLWKNFWNPKCP